MRKVFSRHEIIENRNVGVRSGIWTRFLPSRDVIPAMCMQRFAKEHETGCGRRKLLKKSCSIESDQNGKSIPRVIRQYQKCFSLLSAVEECRNEACQRRVYFIHLQRKLSRPEYRSRPREGKKGAKRRQKNGEKEYGCSLVIEDSLVDRGAQQGAPIKSRQLSTANGREMIVSPRDSFAERNTGRTVSGYLARQVHT